MSTDSSHIFDATLGLSDDERAKLAQQLLQTLKPSGVSSADDSAFEAELDRRVADYEAGKTSASDWDDVARPGRGWLMTIRHRCFD